LEKPRSRHGPFAGLLIFDIARSLVAGRDYAQHAHTEMVNY
jgi:hypothetical protein